MSTHLEVAIRELTRETEDFADAHQYLDEVVEDVGCTEAAALHALYAHYGDEVPVDQAAECHECGAPAPTGVYQCPACRAVACATQNTL